MTVDVKNERTPRSSRAATRARAEGPQAKLAQRGDRRAARTIERILAAAIEAMLDCGAARLSASDVCDRAGISRATYYRYFASKEDLLTAVSQHARAQTDRMLIESIDELGEAAERWDALVNFPDTATPQTARLLEMEPSFTLRYLQDGFESFVDRLTTALGPVYDAWEKELDGPLDRDMISELLIRYSLSEMLVPGRRSRPSLSAGLGRMIALMRRRPG
jgi:AcrR family transcriptional regulator